MFGKNILKFLVSWFLVACLLIGNITFACASSSDPLEDSNSYQNKTKDLGDTESPGEDNTGETQFPGNGQNQGGLDNPERKPQEDSETNPVNPLVETPEGDSAGDDLTESLKEDDTNSSKNVQIEDSENIQNKNSKNIRIERSDSTQTKKPVVQELPEQWESKPAPPSASVSLHGEKTDVIAGEDILLKLSAVNLITKPPMHVQVIIIPPSGMSVSSSEFVQSGAGQYTTTYELDPGQGRDIEVRIESYQPGEFNVKGRVVYYFGKNIKNAEDYTLELPITVKEKPASPQEVLPGFTISGLVVVLIAALILKRNYR